MGIMCTKCKKVVSGAKGLHLFSKCKFCGNDNIDEFIIVDDEDLDAEEHKRLKEWLESRKAE